MTIINLPEDLLTVLRADVAAQGRPAEEAAINVALDELEMGKSRPFDEFVQEFPARFEARHRHAAGQA